MSSPTIARGSATIVGLSSIYSAATGYVTLLVAAHVLSPHENATFLVFWALLFGLYGVATGVSSEATRASHYPPEDRRGASIVLVALGYGTIIAVVALGSAPLWAPRILHEDAPLVLVAALACLAYTGHLGLWGVVTGLRRWRAVAGLVFWEATARLVLLGLALLWYSSLDGLAIAAGLPAAAWVVALILPSLRQAAARRSATTSLRLLRNYSIASLASSASALLMVGFPVLISATSSAAELATSAGLILGISLTRAPLLVPLTSLQGVALTYFLRTLHLGRSALLRTVGPVLGVTAAGAGLAYLVGPWLFRALLGGKYALDGGTLAMLTVSAGLLATLTLTGMFALALHRHQLFACGWVTATATAILLLFLPLPVTERVIWSLLAGPLLGVVVHLIGLSRRVDAGNSAPTASSA
ncbi:MAG: hypothetical protein QM650_10180 [Microlunatus sp.]